VKHSELLAEGPIESFIFLEASQALELADKINRRMDQLDAVLQGKGLMTTDIRKVVDKLMDRVLPK
jgi:hypothetical protein